MLLRINEKLEERKETSLSELISSYRKEHNYLSSTPIVSILNGYQTEESTALEEFDEITLIPKGILPNKEELEGMMRARNTPSIHNKIKNTHIAIVGLGGLGSNIAISLARTGIGYLHLIDYDTVEPSNLNRQQYRIKDLGRFKTEALKEEIKEINPYIDVQIDTLQVTSENLRTLFVNDVIVCEAVDQAETKELLVHGILEHYANTIVVAASGMAGYDSSNTIRTKRITNRFYLCGDETTDPKPGRGLMAPRVSICAGHQANIILRLLVGETDV